jgi:hypothetical protein
VDQGLTEFTPIENLGNSLDFTEIYGDSFISGTSKFHPHRGRLLLISVKGFQEGGEFVAVISIKVKDKNQKESIAAKYVECRRLGSHI